MSIRTGRLIFYLILIVIISFSFWLYRVNYFIKEKPLQVMEPGYIVLIPKGASVQDIADKLAADKVLKHPDWFVLWVRLKERQKIKAGEYLIKPGMTSKDLINMLTEGKVLLHSLTIVEGWTFDRVLEAIQQSPKLNHTLTGLDVKAIMEKLGYPKEHPEGRFYPETYYFPLGTTDVQFLTRAHRTLNQKLTEIWAERDPDLPLKTPYEALILASIIERESRFPEEYSEIAGVYIRRLTRNMPLQADPTVVYGVKENYQGQLTKEHLASDSPYNTYLKTGLPPTPIAMPSQKAIYAATHPKPGNTLYFVARADGKGHVFTRSHEEHQVEVARYRQALVLQTSKKIDLPNETNKIVEQQKAEGENAVMNISSKENINNDVMQKDNAQNQNKSSVILPLGIEQKSENIAGSTKDNEKKKELNQELENKALKNAAENNRSVKKEKNKSKKSQKSNVKTKTRKESAKKSLEKESEKSKPRIKGNSKKSPKEQNKSKGPVEKKAKNSGVEKNSAVKKESKKTVKSKKGNSKDKQRKNG